METDASSVSIIGQGFPEAPRGIKTPEAPTVSCLKSLSQRPSQDSPLLSASCMPVLQ